MDAARNSEGGAGSFYHLTQPHHHNHRQSTNPSASPPSTGAIPNSNENGSYNNSSNASVYPHLLASAVATSSEGVKRKRGRPRKYATLEEAAAAKRLSASSSSAAASGSRKRAGDSAGSSSHSFPDKSQLNSNSIGTTGQGFSSSVMTVAAGEDVSQRILMFMQQSKREICIMSASGSLAYATLRQTEPSGRVITCKGPFEILSLNGSYIHTENGGHTGGLSVSLCTADGQIIGGGVGGPLAAAGPVQVIVGSFLIDVKKDINGGSASSGKLTPPPLGGGGGGGGGGGLNLHGGSSSHQSGVVGSQFFVQEQLMMMPQQSMEWRGHNIHGLQQQHLSPAENVNYHQHIGD